MDTIKIPKQTRSKILVISFPFSKKKLLGNLINNEGKYFTLYTQNYLAENYATILAVFMNCRNYILISINFVKTELVII